MAMVDGAPEIAIIGLGNLGLPMAIRLLRSGHDVVGSDLDPARMSAFHAAGGTAAPPGDLTPHGVVCLVLPDAASVEPILDPDTLSGLATPDGLILVHSTISPGDARRLAAQCREAGYGYVDAPVSGGADRAASGTLTTLVGAAEDDLRRAWPVLEAIASDIVHLGPPGAGSAAKLANQLMLFATLAGAYEAIEIARGYGLTEDAVLRAASTGTARSWVTESWGFYDRLITEYDQSGIPESHRPWAKDPAQAVGAAKAVEVDAPLAALLAEQLPDLIRRHADQSPTRPTEEGSAEPS